MAIAIVLSVFGLGFFCWLVFTLAAYALPFFVGLSAGLAAFHSGSGFLGALVVGILVGVATLVLGQIVFAIARTPLIRLLIGLVYAVPATVAGYQVCFAVAGIGVPAGNWQYVFAAVGATAVGLTAFARMVLCVPPSAGQGPLARNTQPSAFGHTTCGGDRFTSLAIGQIGKDGGEARIVELEGKVVPALVRLLRPGSPDLGAGAKDTMAWSIAELVGL